MDNENEFELNGKRYVAVSPKGCYGCAFFDDLDGCLHALPCSSTNRSDGRNVIYVEVPKPEPKPKTNGDRIRAMDNEELADFLAESERK